MTDDADWPALPLDAWAPTCATLHMWCQIARCGWRFARGSVTGGRCVRNSKDRRIRVPPLDTAVIVLAGIALLAAFVNGALGYGFSSLTVPVALVFYTIAS